MPTLTTLYPDNGTVDVLKQYGLGWSVEPSPAGLAAGILEHAFISEQWCDTALHAARIAREELDWEIVLERLLAFAGVVKVKGRSLRPCRNSLRLRRADGTQAEGGSMQPCNTMCLASMQRRAHPCDVLSGNPLRNR